jgi:hypothetical protein
MDRVHGVISEPKLFIGEGVDLHAITTGTDASRVHAADTRAGSFHRSNGATFCVRLNHSKAICARRVNKFWEIGLVDECLSFGYV